MEVQRFLATDKLHVGTSLAQQSCQVERGRSAANHDNIAALKRLDLVMARTMGKECWWQECQTFGNIVEVGDANCQHHRAGLDCLTVLELQQEPIRQSIDTRHELVLKLRHHPIPEG